MAEEKEVYDFEKRIQNFRSTWEKRFEKFLPEDLKKEDFFFEISMLEQGEQDEEQETFQITLSDELMKKFIQERAMEIVKAIERNYDLQSEKGKEQELLKIRGQKITTKGEFGLSSISHIFSAIEARIKKEIEERKSQIRKKIEKNKEHLYLYTEKILSSKKIQISHQVFFRNGSYYICLRKSRGKGRWYGNLKITFFNSSIKELEKIIEDKIEEIYIILNLKK